MHPQLGVGWLEDELLDVLEDELLDVLEDELLDVLEDELLDEELLDPPP